MIFDFEHSSHDYDEILTDYDRSWKCPDCGGKFHRHGCYSRYLLDWNDESGQVETVRMDILRLKCAGCKRTHAVLTSDIIPFRNYSYNLIVDLVGSEKEESLVSEVGKEDAVISYQIVYMLLSFFMLQLAGIKEVLEAYGILPEDETNRKICSAMESVSHPSFQERYLRIKNSPVFLGRRNTEDYPLVFLIPENPT